MLELDKRMRVAVHKSHKQRVLEQQGCVFRSQELLDNHETNPTKECYCGRPNGDGATYNLLMGWAN